MNLTKEDKAMLETYEEYLIESVSSVLETTAFIFALPPEEELPIPDEGVTVSIHFTGPVSGQIQLSAGHELIQLLASNLLCVDPIDPQAQEKSIDAFKELVNATCGVLLPRLANDPSDVFDVTIPDAHEFNSTETWENAVATSDASVLDCDGLPLLAKFKLM